MIIFYKYESEIWLSNKILIVRSYVGRVIDVSNMLMWEKFYNIGEIWNIVRGLFCIWSNIFINVNVGFWM